MLRLTLASLVALLLPAVLCEMTALDYSCNPSGVITVQNPDPTTYSNAHAQTADGIKNCSVMIFFTGTIVISECPISKNISLWLFESTYLPTIITGDLEFYTIRCQQIPATGIYRKVTDESWVTNYISTSLEPSVTPKVLLNTQIEEVESGIERTSAIVGEPLIWEIEGPENYFIIPLNCTAYSGAGDSACVILNGCSLDTYLVGHFESVPGQPHILQADLWAFRFASSEQVIFICDMLACHNQSSLCDINCPGARRRKALRNLGAEEIRNLGHYVEKEESIIIRRSFTVDRREEQTSSNDIGGQVRTTLKVSYPSELPRSRGSSAVEAPSAVLLVTAFFVALLEVVYPRKTVQIY